MAKPIYHDSREFTLYQKTPEGRRRISINERRAAGLVWESIQANQGYIRPTFQTDDVQTMMIIGRAQMTAKQWTYYKLYYIDEYNTREIAEMFNVSVSTISHTIKRARAKVDVMLQALLDINKLDPDLR